MIITSALKGGVIDSILNLHY